MGRLIGQILLSLMAGAIAKAICEAIGNRALSKLITMATILILTVTIVKSPTVKAIGEGINNTGKTFQKINDSLERYTNPKAAEKQYDPTQPPSFSNPLPDSVIFGTKK